MNVVRVMSLSADQTSAHCSCGWSASPGNPVQLQQAIEKHYILECTTVSPEPPRHESESMVVERAVELTAHCVEQTDEERRLETLQAMLTNPADYRYMRRLLPDWMFAQRYPEMLTR